MNPFGWIRRKAAEAFVQGIADGAAAITPEGETPPADLNELRAMLAQAVAPKALAAAPVEEEAEPAAKARKAR